MLDLKDIMSKPKEKSWISRDYLKCTGCRRCEIACALHHENKIWPKASKIRVFMLVPGVEIPHFCTQCTVYPCVKACSHNALSIDENTSAVLVNGRNIRILDGVSTILGENDIIIFMPMVVGG